MSSVIKWVLVLVVLAGGGWLVWYSGWLSTLTGPKTATVVTTVATTTPTAPTPPPQPPINMNGMSDAKDASDAALVQDTAAQQRRKGQKRSLIGNASTEKQWMGEDPGPLAKVTPLSI